MVEGSLAFVALTVWRPRMALGAVAASLPFHAAVPEHLSLVAGPGEMALLLSTAGIGLRWLLERLGLLKLALIHPAPTRFDLPAALFLTAALTSLLVTEYLHLSLRELRVLVIEPVIYYYLLSAVLRDAIDVRRIVDGLLAGACVVALLGVGQVLTGWNATEAEGVRRAVGLYGSPNHLGLYLGRALPFLLAGLLWYGGTRWRAYVFGAVSAAAGLAATFSFGAWMGSAVAVLAIGQAFYRVTPQRRRLILAATAVVLAILLVVAIPLARTERFASRLSAVEGTTTFFRLQLWSASLAMLRDHPILGVGLDNFLYLYQQEYLPEAAVAEPNLSHPHNLILHFWLQMGLLGVAAIGWLLARFFVLADRLFHASSSSTVRALALGAAASMLDVIVHGMVDNSYFLPDLAYAFWLSLACAQVLAEHSSKETERA